MSDPSWSNVVLAMHMDGTVGSTSFVDEKGNTVTASGGAVLSDMQSKFGGVSGQFVNGALSIPAVPGFNLGTNDFTIEFWLFPSSAAGVYRAVFGQIGSDSYAPLRIELQGLRINLLGSTTGSSWSFISEMSYYLTQNVWQHIAVVVSSGVLNLYVDGVLRATRSSINFASSSNPMLIGGASSVGYLNGYVDDLRMVNGEAVYTSDFTPPTAPFSVPTVSDASSTESASSLAAASAAMLFEQAHAEAASATADAYATRPSETVSHAELAYAGDSTQAEGLLAAIFQASATAAAHASVVVRRKFSAVPTRHRISYPTRGVRTNYVQKVKRG